MSHAPAGRRQSFLELIGRSDLGRAGEAATLPGIRAALAHVIAQAGGSTTATAGPDTLTGTSGPDTIDGLGGDDTIAGLDGDDILIGGTGADALTGGPGNDAFYVDAPADRVAEASGEGTDRVYASVSYSLPSRDGSIEIVSTTDPLDTAAIALRGNEFANTIYGNNGENALYGGRGDDTLNGYAGDDVLIGGAGADTMRGERGDDSYYVDVFDIFGNNPGDVVVEGAGEGADRVYAGVTYVLPIGVSIEILSTTDYAGTAAINLTANELANTVFGNNGRNELYGGGGNDTLHGYEGDDELLGGAGADTMIGGLGDDSYYVDVGDVIVEAEGEGIDHVVSSMSYVLPAGLSIEQLGTGMSGTAPIELTGNALDNYIYGNRGDNVLYGGWGNDQLMGLNGDDTLVGGTGVDTMFGGRGNDSYYVDDAGDDVGEPVSGALGGIDRIYASVSYALGLGPDADFIEILSTADPFGTAAITLNGNELANTIYGNFGANTLMGGLGNDTLYGYAGADTFRFDTWLGASNVDRIGDYSVADDTIQLQAELFSNDPTSPILALGPLAAGAFAIGPAAAEADDRIIYNSATGALLFDADGSGAGAAILFATLTAGLAMTNAEFLVVM